MLSDMRDDLPGGKNTQIRQNCEETSAVANSKAAERKCAQPGWYREIRTLKWVWQGLDPWLLQDVQARIAVSESPRTHPQLLDTVIGFRPGNWTYEWSQEGANTHQQGIMLWEEGQQEAAKQTLMRASLFYTIASYPHFRGDMLASDAHIQANRSYREAGELMGCPLRTLDIPVAGKTLPCYLHIPEHAKDSMPLVIVSGGGDALQTDFYRVFRSYLEPHGIAMLTVDMPGVGYAQHCPLQQDTACVHRAVLDYLANLDYIDQQRVAMIGLRMGGNSAMRLACTDERLRAVALIGAPLHDVFVKDEIFSAVSMMSIDELASRLGVDGANRTLLKAEAKQLSLKTQGLLSKRRIDIPLLAIAHPADPMGTLADAQLAANVARSGEVLKLSRSGLFSSLEESFFRACHWLGEKLSSR